MAFLRGEVLIFDLKGVCFSIFVTILRLNEILQLLEGMGAELCRKSVPLGMIDNCGILRIVLMLGHVLIVLIFSPVYVK